MTLLSLDVHSKHLSGKLERLRGEFNVLSDRSCRYDNTIHDLWLSKIDVVRRKVCIHSLLNVSSDGKRNSQSKPMQSSHPSHSLVLELRFETQTARRTPFLALHECYCAQAVRTNGMRAARLAAFAAEAWQAPKPALQAAMVGGAVRSRVAPQVEPPVA